MKLGILQPNTLFYRIFHDSPVGMVITTIAEGRYVEVNRSYAELLGYTPDELIGQTFPMFGLVYEEERNLVLEVLRLTGKLADVPLLLRTREGEVRTAIGSVQLEEIDGGEYLVSIIQDLTDRERVQSALHESQNRFRFFFQSIPLPLWVFDLETLRILDVNPAACRSHGYSHDEFTHLNVAELLPPEELAGFVSQLTLIKKGRHAQTSGWHQRRKDGSVIDVDMVSYAFDLDGQPACLSIVQDVTERRAVETALRASEERLRVIADVATDAIWDRDMVTDAVGWSSGLHSLFGFELSDDYPHQWWSDHVHPDERDAVNDSIDALMASQDNYWTAQYRFLRSDGLYANVLDRGFVVRDEAGRPTRFIGAMVDITAQLQVAEAAARAALEERQRLARDLHEAVTQSLYSASLMAEAARRHSTENQLSVSRDYIVRLSDLSKQALRQLRLLVYELRPTALEQEGLIGALRYRLEAVEQRAGIHARLIDETHTTIPADLQSELFWIAQEALNNSLKHAAATHMTVTVTMAEGQIWLEVRDDGRGFDPDEGHDGSGLQHLRDRVDKLGGTLDIESRAGEGVTVRVQAALG